MFEAMQFTGRWRDYQQRVLDEIEHHLGNARINVVAAPGSGKTVLGLELVRRLGRPAIVLAPSLTIRNQWAERLVPLFLRDRPGPEWVSHRLESPAVLTGATYQSLHAIWNEDGGGRFAALLAWAKAHGPITLVLDEAHHLRREWWRALDALVAGLADVRIVALTATPPYDAPLAEWTRFEETCGPIDIEIGIPELVRNGDLCPHQDHVVFSRPAGELMALLDERRAAVATLVAEVRADEGLAEALAHHPWLVSPLDHLAPILDNPTILSSMLVHLAATGRPLPKEPLRLLGVEARDAPAQSERWFEALLNALLYDLGELSPLDPAARKALADRLHRQGLIEGERVRLGETERIVRMMAGDRAKLGSIARIAETEAAQCGSDLRMVILTDHVRAGELPKRPEPRFVAGKIGVATIFETLRRASLAGQSLGVLTGTLVILPDGVCEALVELGAERGIAAGEFLTTALAHCDGYRTVAARGEAKRAMTALVTELFQRGVITVLVGTQALLGEGWDAPAINSLVLASNSASYMLSNQMRGRAIRIDPKRPGKVSNIWHLATVADPIELGGVAELARSLDWGGIALGRGQTADLALLARRFDAFAGISNDGSTRIGTGLARLSLGGFDTLEAANAMSFLRAADRSGIARDWAVSLGDAPARAHVREIAAPTYSPHRLVWRDTIEHLALSGASTGATAGAYAVVSAFGAQPLTLLLAGAASTATLASLPKLAKSLALAWRNGSVEGSLRQVGETVLYGLRLAGLIAEEEFLAASVDARPDGDGAQVLSFDGIGRSLDLMAMDALAELLGPVQNPRYLIRRRSGLLGRGADFHAIPALFSKNKAMAEAFAAEWSKRVGPSTLVYTRTPEGRLALLEARRNSLAAGMQRRVERRSDWR